MDDIQARVGDRAWDPKSRGQIEAENSETHELGYSQ